MVCETVTSKKGDVGVIIAVPEDRCESLCALLQWELSIQRLALIPKTTLLFCLDIHIWVRELHLLLVWWGNHENSHSTCL